MLCFELKSRRNKFRVDWKNRHHSTFALLGTKDRFSSAERGSPRHQEIEERYEEEEEEDEDSTPRPKRDRSRSLCVDHVGPLISVEKPNSSEKPNPVFQRRRSTCNAITSSSDFISRRGVFSRRHYGSIEMLPKLEMEGSGVNGRRFRVESGDPRGDREEIYGSPVTPVLENPEYQTRWYFKYFLGKFHQNYVGCDCEKSPFLLSVVLSDANNQRVPQYRAILWKKAGAQKICLSYNSNKPMTVKVILSNFSNMEKLEKGPKEIFSPDIQKDLLLLEEQEGSVNFKFGVLYMKPGQISDDDILSNEKGSEYFDKFLNLLGDKIRLKGWDKFRGGLDVKGDMTGKYSVYTIYEGHEIMFHISTLLPFSTDNKQQVERKRHIGNDIANVIFLDASDCSDVTPNFMPSCIKSQFTHIFALVTYCALDDSYRMQIFSEETVPLFGPSLPTPPTFTNHEEFREFLLVKLINGEKATFNTPTFAKKRQRTLDILIKDIYQEHMVEGRGTMLNRRALSDVLPDPPRGSRRKEEARRVEFVRFGQALKLDTIVKGDAPTSLATTGLFKRTPWEPMCFYPDFPSAIACGDSWGDQKLFLAAPDGVFLVEEGVHHRMVLDKSVVVKQLSVVEAHGILLLRADKGRDCRIHVFRLSDFEADLTPAPSTDRPRSRVDIKEKRVERTKGCHLYALSKPGGSHLRMIVAVGRKLLILQWRHSAAWTAWCPTSDTDTVEGFLFLREISLPDTPSLITLIDSPFANSGGGVSDNQICVGYKNHWDLLSEKTGESVRLYSVEASKVNLVTAIHIYEDDESELLLCHNNACHFQKLSSLDINSTEFDFQWNSVPTAIVCAFPYILAFTQDSVEIRLVINGNLIQTMVMPSLTFLTSKGDIFFATTAPEFISINPEPFKEDRAEGEPSLSPPSSPPARERHPFERAVSTEPEYKKPFRIYRIPFASISGAVRCPTPSADHLQSQMSEKEEGTGSSGELEDANEAGREEKTRGKTELSLQVESHASFSLSKSCNASPTKASLPISPMGSRSSPLSPTKFGFTSGSPSKGSSGHRNRTNSLTVEMGTFPFRQIPQTFGQSSN